MTPAQGRGGTVADESETPLGYPRLCPEEVCTGCENRFRLTRCNRQSPAHPLWGGG